jgi:hypothetical protein
MSSYINEYIILSAIKTILDADSTLGELLGVMVDSSKVILGMERPNKCSSPTIHLSFLTRNIPETKLNSVLLRVVWFVNAKATGEEDIETIANIGERVYDLLDDYSFTVPDYQIDSFSAESGESSAKDQQEPEGRENHFQSLTFQMSIRRI